MRRTRHSGKIRPLSSTGGAGVSVIPLAASGYRSPQVPGHRTNPASKPQAPNQRGGAPIWSDMSDKSDRSDMSDTAPHRTLMHNQTVFQYWRAGLSVIPLAASGYRTIRSTEGKKKNLSDECESLKGSKKNSRHRATLP